MDEITVPQEDLPEATQDEIALVKHSDTESKNGFTHPAKRRKSKHEPADIDSNPKIKMIELDKLVTFENHPFKLYEGQRFTDMVESIRSNGVLVPIVVRPHPAEEEKYEILSGHNRTAAAREALLEFIPAVIRKGLSDEEALLVVTETNLVQRSFADMRHSERAIVISKHYEAMKKKSGYRSDLLAEIETLTSAPVGRRSETRDKLGSQYGLGKTTVARYLRVNKLIKELKERLDDDEIGMRVAEALSYLRAPEQEIVNGLLVSGKKISIKQADELKAESEKGELSKEFIEQVFEPLHYPAKVKPVKLSGEFLSQHFKANQSAEDIESVIAEALAQYFERQQ